MAKTSFTTVFGATPKCDVQQMTFSKRGDIHSYGIEPEAPSQRKATVCTGNIAFTPKARWFRL